MTVCMTVCRLDKKDDGSIDFYYQGKDGETKCLNCGLVLFGTGRKPLVHDMGLEVNPLSCPRLTCIQQPRLHRTHHPCWIHCPPQPPFPTSLPWHCSCMLAAIAIVICAHYCFVLLS